MGFHPLNDYWRWASEVDVIADDTYGDPADSDSPVRQALAHDLMRGLAGGAPWLLMEQAVSAVPWRGHNLPKTPGQTRLDSLRAIARGADGSCFFQWRQSAFGSERFHSALVPHAGPDTRLHRAVRAHGAELRRLDRVVGARVAARVALVFDWSSWWAAEEPAGPSTRLRVMDQMIAYYRPLWRAGIAVDFVPPGGDLSGYDLVVAPQLFLVDDPDARNLRGVVERGGVLVLGPFSGVADADAHIRLGRFPVQFADLVGGSGEEYCPLPDAGLRVRSAELGDFTATVWGERLRLDDGEAVATFTGDLDGSPAVLRRRAASGGEAWYVGTVPPSRCSTRSWRARAASAGVVGALGPGPLPDGVEAVRRGDVLFLLNTSGYERQVALAGAYRDLLTGTDATGAVCLGPEGALALIDVIA